MEVNYIIEQIEKTKDLLNSTKENDKYYLTILLNSLLSLIILPVEDIKRNSRKTVFKTKYKDFLRIIGVAPIIFDPNEYNDGIKTKTHYKTTSNFISKLRHGIAHQCIEIVIFENNTFITIFNIMKLKKTKIKDFEIKLSVKELKKLSLFISNNYLKSIKL